MPDATFEDFCALAGEVAMGKHPIPPHPEWGQDAAMIGSFINSWRKKIAILEDIVDTEHGYVYFLLTTYNLWSPEGTFTFPDGLTVYRDERDSDG